MKKFILCVFVIVGILNATCTRNNTKKIVSCNDSGLMWQDDNNINNNKKEWQEAINYCEDLNFAGYNDWRLPNYNEIESIIDYKKYNPSINSAFQNTSSYGYWSSTTNALQTVGAMSFDFRDGSAAWSGKLATEYVRCVRTGQ